MNETTTYESRNGDVYVDVTFYPVDGFRATVSVWDSGNRAYRTAYDKRVIADSFWEGMGSALTQALDIEWEEADAQLADWGIFPPDEEGDE